ncbi:hypothetical protein BASA81_004516 [Batrachochytrium salamandrivorans]|nr:hypothetical protein BASA81_004516 [Batrachochytrium salamandrivorans]
MSFAIYGPELLPYIPKIRQQIPILVENLDSLLPLMGDAVDQWTPLVYWLAAYMPLAKQARVAEQTYFTPSQPTRAGATSQRPGATQDLRYAQINSEKASLPLNQEPHSRPTQGFAIPLVRQCKHSRVHYYVLAYDGKYLGEVRYSTLLKLHVNVVLPRDASPSNFPAKGRRPDVEMRRQELETYLVRVLNNRSITSSQDFKVFLQTSFPESLQAELGKLL